MTSRRRLTIAGIATLAVVGVAALTIANFTPPPSEPASQEFANGPTVAF